MTAIQSSTRTSAGTESRKGFAFGVLAYVIWGLSTGFYKLMPHIPPLEIVAHRAAWAVPLAVILLAILGGGSAVLPILRNWKIMRVLLVSATIIGTNWSLFIWAVTHEMMLEASLAYYINPLLSVLLGFLLLGERLSRAQIVAIGIAATAVLFQTVADGIFPGLGLFLATTFAIYGYLRKTVPVGAIQGFLIETLLILPFAVVAIAYFEGTGQGHMFTSLIDLGYLVACTGMTAAPLMLFAAAAQRLPLSMIGLMQYIAPTIGFIIAVWIFNEPLTPAGLITFVLIWVALAIFSWSALSSRRATPPTPSTS